MFSEHTFQLRGLIGQRSAIPLLQLTREYIQAVTHLPHLVRQHRLIVLRDAGFKRVRRIHKGPVPSRSGLRESHLKLVRFPPECLDLFRGPIGQSQPDEVPLTVLVDLLKGN